MRSLDTRLTSQRRQCVERAGAATVELAIVMPVFLLLAFGSVEICQRIFIRQSVVIAAYETARHAARQTSTTQSVTAKCVELLAQQNVAGATVQVRDISHGVNHLNSIATGDEFRIRVTVPWGENSVSRFVIPDQGSFTVDAFMLRE